MNKPLKGFITYSHKDVEQKDELRERLAVMEQKNELVTWDDCQLIPGDEALQEDILEKVADSDLLIYLISAASLASKNCNRELTEALNQKIKVIPIILEHCDWLFHELSDFEVLPEKGKPLTKWPDKSEGWQNVVNGIRKAVEKINSQENLSSEISERKLRAEAAFQFGNILMMFGQLDIAIEGYSDAIDLNPCYIAAYHNRGIAYGKKEKYNLSIKDCTKVIELNLPADYNTASAYTNRGNAYTGTGDFNKAIKDCTKAIKLNPYAAS